MVSITLCMIVKNEEAVLGRCLDSYAGLFDEIIIVDTGSTDSTKNIARRYTDKIYDYEWIDDFAAARNYAFSLAGCDYIFSADADEMLDEANRDAFMQLKSVLLPEIDIVQMKYVNVSTDNSVYNSKRELRPKLFKRLRTFEWVSPIHETVRLKPVIFDSDIEILHMPVVSHSKRDFTTFVKALERGVMLENYVVNMFCKELVTQGSDEDLISLLPVFEKYMTSYTSDECYREVRCALIKMYRVSGNSGLFYKEALKAVADEPSSEVCLELGKYYQDLEDYEEAVLWYINAISETSPILDVHTSGDMPLALLSECYSHMADIKKSTGDTATAAHFSQMSKNYASQAVAWELPEEI